MSYVKISLKNNCHTLKSNTKLHTFIFAITATVMCAILTSCPFEWELGVRKVYSAGDLGGCFSSENNFENYALLMKDISSICVYSVSVDSQKTLDLNGHCVTSTTPLNNNAVILVEGELTIKDRKSGGSIKNSGKAQHTIEILRGGNLIIESSVYEAINGDVYVNDGGKITIID